MISVLANWLKDYAVYLVPRFVLGNVSQLHSHLRVNAGADHVRYGYFAAELIKFVLRLLPS